LGDTNHNFENTISRSWVIQITISRT